MNKVTFPNNVALSFRADPEAVQTKLLFAPDYPETEMISFSRQLAAQIGDQVFSIEYPGDKSTDIVSVISQTMDSRQLTLSVTDCFSHGLIAAKCVGHNWVREASYSHSFNNLCSAFGIQPATDLLLTGKQIAEMTRCQNQTNIVLLQLAESNGVALHDKNQSLTLYHILATESATLTRVQYVSGPSHRKYNQAAILALDFLRRYLQDKST
jgi:hypothetical protein